MSDGVTIVRTADDLKEGLAARKKAPDRDYLRRRYPKAYREVVDPNTGRTEWRVGGVREDGRPRLTPEQQREFNASFRPFMRAEAERGANLRSRRPENVALRDKDGGRRYVHPALADGTARRNGWRSGARPRVVNPIERGEGGMLWKLIAGAWMPLGVRCLGRPIRGSRIVAKRGIQYDPDGRPWRFVAGEWTRL